MSEPVSVFDEYVFGIMFAPSIDALDELMLGKACFDDRLSTGEFASLTALAKRKIDSECWLK